MTRNDLWSEKPLRVAYVTMQFPTPRETFASSDVLALADQGVEVSVHSLRPRHPDAEQLMRSRGLRDVPSSHGSLVGWARGLKIALSRPRRLAGLLSWLFGASIAKPGELLKSLVLVPRAFEVTVEIERRNPDVVHLFWGHYPTIVGWLVQRGSPHMALSVFLGAYDMRMRYEGTALVANRADLIWTHVAANRDEIARLGVPRSRIEVVRRGIRVEQVAAVVSAVPKTPRRIVVVGALSPTKGVADAIEVFARAQAECPDASLAVLGGGSDRDRLESLARTLGVDHRVDFFGHVPHEVVLEHMAAAEVLLHMSKVDYLPNVVKEAMAARCICVCTETTGIRELVPSDDHGFVVPIGDVAGAASRVVEILRGEVDVSSMRVTASRHIEMHFNVEKSMRTYRTKWQETVELVRDSVRRGTAAT